MNSDSLFSNRISSIKPSFVREILKVIAQPDVISFAGGLPDKDYFPCEVLSEITHRMLRDQGKAVLQYGQSEGEIELREQISTMYRDQHQMDIPVENILITNGSQQGFDLIGKTLINENDPVVIESPGFLGAIQALTLFQPKFLPVPIKEDGLDVHAFSEAMQSNPKLIYTVPNFQNPTGFSYNEANRAAIANLVKDKQCVVIEDDPYGDVRFNGQRPKSFHHWLPDQTILLGSFSKIISPGLRVGWIVAPTAISKKLLIAKQASDLHTSRLSQRIIFEYIQQGFLANHIEKLCQVYGARCELMGQALDDLFGTGIKRSRPDGGMFIWLDFLESIDTMALFHIAQRKGIAFVPGQPFYTPEIQSNSIRLNYSCSSELEIQTGLERLYHAYLEYQTL